MDTLHRFNFRELQISAGLIIAKSQEPVQVGSRNMKAAGRQSLIAIVLTDGCQGKPDLVVRKMLFERSLRKICADIDNILISSADFSGQVVGVDVVSLAENEGALDDVFQLANISRPWVGLEQSECLRIDAGCGQVIHPGVDLQEM